MSKQSTARSTREVFEDHLRLRKSTSTEEDIERNYAPDVVILASSGTHRGHDGVRETASILKDALPGGTYEYTKTLVDGEFAYLEWTGRSEESVIDDGADSFVIRGGQIVAQTMHYKVRSRT